MYILGITLSFVTAFLYSLRYSFIKDLKSHSVSNLQINFYYRLFSLPVLFILAYFIKQRIFSFQADFIIWLLISLAVNVIWSLYSVYIYQKSPFSSIESLQFLNIVFGTIFGAILFNEILSFSKMLGIFITVLALFILMFNELKDKKQVKLNIAILGYYFITAVVDSANKQAIAKSSPIIFSISVTILLLIVYFFLIKFRKDTININAKSVPMKILILIGLISGLSALSLSYVYKLLPLGVAVTLVSSRVFFSLWLSKKKYQEKNIVSKIISSGIALAGMAIMFIG
jgi:drug/metabolite transporter (DMT)-like permease